MSIANFFRLLSKWFPLLCLALFVLVGIGVHRDYSIGGDGIWIRTIGGRTALQINQKLDYLLLSEAQTKAYIQRVIGTERTGELDSLTKSLEVLPNDRFHGVWFEFALLGSEVILGHKDWQDIYFTRHLLTHLYFLLALCCFYLLLMRVFQNWKAALLGTIMLLLSPRIYAHSFFNSKDLPFLSTYWIAIWAMFRYIDKPNYKSILLLALSSALAISLRMMGILIPVFVVGI